MAQTPNPQKTPKGMLSNDYLCILAIDIGTINMGYAYSLKTKKDFKPDAIFYSQWKTGKHFSQVKTPTCILLNGEKKLVSFGFEAEDQYIQKIENKQQSDYYLFSNFKMVLYQKKIKRIHLLTDINEKQLSATLVFGESISAMVKDFSSKMKNQGYEFAEKDMRYVLTVPAIWSDAAKQKMRQSANNAGIKDEQLLIALEPEAASLYSQYVETKSVDDTEITVTKIGTRYLVADLGGGTADIAVHQKLPDGHLRELHRSRGDDCGGESINDAFFDEVKEYFGDDLMKEIKKDRPSIYWEVYREFEVSKKNFKVTRDEEMVLKLPIPFLAAFFKRKTEKDLLTVIEIGPHKGAVTLKNGNSLHISQAYATEKLFKPTADRIVALLESIVLKVEGTKMDSNLTIGRIILVGGLSESNYIQETIRKTFPKKHVITHETSDLCVLKGALLFGHNPGLISHRVIRFTYGISTLERFDSKIHDKKRKITLDGGDFCKQIFTRYVETGAVVEINTRYSKRLSTTCQFQDELSFPVYTSPIANPQYIDDFGCEKIGKMSIPISDPTKEERFFEVTLIFGNTEIQILAKDTVTEMSYEATLNFVIF